MLRGYVCFDCWGTIMNISEITPGTELVVKFMIDSAPVAFRTKALSPFKSNGLLVAPLIHNGEPLPDWSDGSIDPFTDANGVRHQFRVDSALAVDRYDRVMHVLYGSELVLHDANRRKSERYVINLLGKADLGKGQVFNVIIYDISMRGISLMLGKCPYKPKRGDVINVSFKKDAASKTFNVACKVTREFMVGTYPTVGCLLMGISPDLLTFILKTRASKETPAAAQSASRVSVRTAPAKPEESDIPENIPEKPGKGEVTITPGAKFSISGDNAPFKKF